MTAFRSPITRRRFLATSAMAAVAAAIPVVEAEAEDDVRVTRLPVLVPNLPAGLAGATVWRGIEGFGAASRIHTATILRMSEDLPVLIEIVDSDEKIRDFLPSVEALLEEAGCGGLITLEKAEVIRYTPGKAGS